jgi:general secretion pathway protein B
MSFILDALKKSETERQKQNTPGFADVPDATSPPRAPRWLWVLGGLLAINLVVLLGVMLRPELNPTTAMPAPTESIPADASGDVSSGSSRETSSAASFSDMVEEAKKKQAVPVAESTTEGITNAEAQPVGRTASVVRTPEKISQTYATFNELRANGTIILPDLHLDIHVYSEHPADRFIFVNMSKYREQGILTEGPVVREITPEGVILEHLGNGFLLPRE